MNVLEEQSGLFSILDTVDSSNNYATGQIHAGLAKHGQAWFAHEQTAGKGQRGKSWKSAPGDNIILSVAIRPGKAFHSMPFLFSVLTANVCREFFAELAVTTITVKWPNDLYWRDRKTGGILIENIYRGKEWEWAVVGIGININQTKFEALENAASLKLITGKDYQPLMLAKELHARIFEAFEMPSLLNNGLTDFNKHLYKQGEMVRLKKDNAVFETRISGVNKFGQLITEDATARVFEVGEVAWVFCSEILPLVIFFHFGLYGVLHLYS